MAPKAQDKAESKAQGKKTKGKTQASGDNETIGERIVKEFKPREKDRTIIAFMQIENGAKIDTKKLAEDTGMDLRTAQSVWSRIRGKYKDLREELTADDGNVAADSDGHPDDAGGDDKDDAGSADAKKATAVGHKRKVANMTADDGNEIDGDVEDDAPKTKKAKKNGARAGKVTGAGKAIKMKQAKK